MTTPSPSAESFPVRLFRRTLVPLFLIVVCPPSAMVFWHVNDELGGSFAALGREMADKGVLTTIWDAWRPVFWGTPTAWALIGAFAVIQLALMRLVPGARWEGPVTPMGNVPLYKANGPASFALTVAAYAGASWGLGLFSPTIIYDHFAGILGALNIFSLVFCVVLYAKGRWAPSTSDHSTTGNPLFDYYWGTELYPRILGWDVKQFTNCRFGMMAWPLILLSFAAAQAERGGLTDAMMVGVGIQLVYIAKFFWWETGYLRSLDIMHDRAGFYICWGCLVWVPAIYTSPTAYLIHQDHTLGWPLALLIFALGVAAVMTNYFADAQRQRVRASDGRATVWGREPVLIHAEYTTELGERKTSLLLASGWWGISRHFHYVPEILGAFFWSVPAGFSHFMPYFYVTFLTVLLLHRSWRDEQRCALKYGSFWEDYCTRVRWRIIPGLF